MRVLCIDVGAGTTDVLLWDSGCSGENQTHLIVPSGTRVVADGIDRATRRRLPVIMEGPLMGGGANASAMRRHVAQGLAFYATPMAATASRSSLKLPAATGVA